MDNDLVLLHPNEPSISASRLCLTACAITKRNKEREKGIEKPVPMLQQLEIGGVVLYRFPPIHDGPFFVFFFKKKKKKLRRDTQIESAPVSGGACHGTRLGSSSFSPSSSFLNEATGLSFFFLSEKKKKKKGDWNLFDGSQ